MQQTGNRKSTPGQPTPGGQTVPSSRKTLFCTSYSSSLTITITKTATTATTSASETESAITRDTVHRIPQAREAVAGETEVNLMIETEVIEDDLCSLNQYIIATPPPPEDNMAAQAQPGTDTAIPQNANVNVNVTRGGNVTAGANVNGMNNANMNVATGTMGNIVSNREVCKLVHQVED